MMKLLFAYISFESEFDLSVTADKISRNIFGGLAFKPNRSKDEIPALSSDYILGHQILISGINNGYVLEIQATPNFFKGCDFPNLEEQNLDELIIYCLSKIEGFKIICC